MTKVKSRRDLEAIGNDDYVPMEGWQYDQMYGAMRPVDAIAAELELRWGVGKLETLVTPETAARFESARAKLDVAIFNKDPELVIKRAGIMKRGWEALADHCETRHMPDGRAAFEPRRQAAPNHARGIARAAAAVGLYHGLCHP